MTVALTLRAVKAGRTDDPEAAAALADEAIAELAGATAELRELARGIHPPVLTEHGLPTAVGTLAARATLPVDVECTVAERLPPAVEIAAYYVVSEALTNMARHARGDEGERPPLVRRRGTSGADDRRRGRRRRSRWRFRVARAARPDRRPGRID